MSGSALGVRLVEDGTHDDDMDLGSNDNLAIKSLSARAADICVPSPRFSDILRERLTTALRLDLLVQLLQPA